VFGIGVRSTDGTSQAAALQALCCGADASETNPNKSRVQQDVGDCGSDSCKSYYGPLQARRFS